ncbi:MAG: SMP-30/gluconolactonase/LRE family protein [Verrucomicrobiales bacterium]|nr:SMP-30/gluconolactonase/LRE family protein [Verrucomicrobiales bacterium]
MLRWLLLMLVPLTLCAQQNAEGPYPVDPDTRKKDGVPAGKITSGTFADSKIYPGTSREYFVYQPTQYDAESPAALMVFQDGKGYLKNVPTVFDNLIHQKAMPPTVAVFINPGVVTATSDDVLARYNRSFEYDAVDDRYARFLLDEILPVALKGLNVTDDPNLRAICGSSSGGIAAFVAAWDRPDAFRRIYTTVGTYVGLRGGNELPVLVRKTEPKPLRIFLQDGSNDNNIYCGSWWVANQDMLASLQWAGYEVNHEWGEGSHNRKHGNAILPKVLRWLWNDWDTNPQITTHVENSQSKAKEFLIPGEDWKLVSEGHTFTEGPAVSESGDLYFSDLEESKVWKVSPEGDVSLFKENTGHTNGLAFSIDGKTLIGCRMEPGRLISWNTETGEESILAKNARPNDVVVAHDGTIYFSEPRKKRIMMIPPGGGEAKTAGEGFSGVNGVVLSTDQSLVLAADYNGRFVWSGQRQADGTLTYIQPYFHLHIPPASIDTRSLADGMAVTEKGWLLVATAMGIQVCDMPGRVNLIIPSPVGDRHPSNVTFYGDTLYATCGSKVFKRKVALKGALPWKAPIKPAKPRL